jgi:hypothetical protein
MRAHIGADVKKRYADKAIKMAVIAGGLTPYLQAGDVGIYKSFKNTLSNFINAWKLSDKVSYTKGGNPRPPSVETVAWWVQTAWKQVPDSVVMKSILKCGFSEDSDEWFISQHDVYDTKFKASWTLSGLDDSSDPNGDENDALNDAFDEIFIE